MGSLFSTFTKIVCMVLMLLYCYSLFRNLSLDYGDGKRRLAKFLYQILLFLHFLCHGVLFFHTKDFFYLIMYGAELCFLVLYPFLGKKIYPTFSETLLYNQCLLLALGWIMLERLNTDKAMKQFAISVAASLLALLIPYFIDKIWDFQKGRIAFAVLGIFLLSLVLIVGRVSFGAKMSLNFFGFSFQASEFVKISFVFSVAGFLSEEQNQRGLYKAAIVAMLHGIVLVLCKDLGSALILFMAFLFMLYVASSQFLYLALGFGLSALAGFVSYHLFSHVRTRVFAFLDPWKDIAGKGYQITQSLFAIGTGGFLGLGLFQGLPNKIPIVENDFIFSALSEEMGGIVAICVILVCLSCFMQMMMMGMDMESLFYKLICIGLSVIYVMQVFLTIGGAIKFIPSTGVTLPFVSYGGSSMISSCILFAIFQALFVIQGKEDAMDEEEEEDEQQAPKRKGRRGIYE